MFKLQLTFLIFAIFAQPSLASANPAKINYGFYLPGEGSVPEAVEKAAESIFQLELPLYSVIQSAAYDFFLKRDGVSMESKSAIGYCRKFGLSSCVIQLGMWSGTAFLDKDPSKIWTNCHMIRGFLDFEKQRWMFEQLKAGKESASLPVKEAISHLFSAPIQFRLKNLKGDTLHSTIEPAFLDAAVISGRFDLSSLNCSAADDAVKIRLNRALSGEGLPWSRERSAYAYLGGFPRPTQTRSALGAPDSDGNRFYWTSGALLSPGAEQDKYFENYPEFSLARSGPYTAVILADSAEGMSGAPILNDAGQVVGIYKGYVKLSTEKADLPFASFGVNAEGMRYVEIYSEGLEK